MKTRIISAAVLIPIVVLCLIFGGIVLQLMILAATLAAIYEVSKAVKALDFRPFALINYVFAVVCAVLVYFGYSQWLLTVLLFFALITMTVPVFFRQFETRDALATIAIMVYPTLLILTLSLNEQYGIWYIVAAIIASVIVDTAAYFSGRAWGKTKLCPEISPKKTVAGAIGGEVAAIVLLTTYGLLITAFALNKTIDVTTVVSWFCLSMICGFFAQFGDLAASAIKRNCGIKDYSNLIPGHGGVMDRLDSVMFTSLIVYLFASMGII